MSPMLPCSIDLGLVLRRADPGDLPALVALLADDSVGATRGDRNRAEDRPAYERAFAAVDADPSQLLVVVDSGGNAAVATMQLTVIPGLSRVGATRLQIEAVRVASALRSRGIGRAMIRWAIGVAPAMGAQIVQLTSDAARADAHRFYERLGFAPSHVGFKLVLGDG